MYFNRIGHLIRSESLWNALDPRLEGVAATQRGSGPSSSGKIIDRVRASKIVDQ